MKKCILAVVTTAALSASPAMADTLAGLYVGAQGWRTSTSGGFADNSTFLDGSTMADFNFDSQVNNAFYAAIEHPVPFLPNVKVNYTTLDSDGNTTLQSTFTFDGELYTAGTNLYTETELTTTDFILYYELFDNDLVSFDVGINGRYVDGTVYAIDTSSNTEGSQAFSGVVPMAYSRVQVGLPFTGLGAYAEGSYLSFDDHKFSDYQIALTYSFIESLAIDMTIQAGYRSVDIDIEDLDDIYADMTFDGPFAGIEIHF
ncbi:TIGR04219 family outer membrane beta-barrel protein [Aestuariibacter sp. A3R04]|uniref:TIGR04219 family outer membrane beta-barrel protein n=1 Tax=Aestuariibacter sp. A3R04 TaxID=2841571 RepID=UPI001C08AD09|nr:TIGR04219 family outer membrane beta-barrel protein [Aestuariibacter sp. A3R04]MBU3021999.1 TIGR04219 family outer membrane beta-barrel protein [Aestuariibacter sp. A3R04]